MMIMTMMMTRREEGLSGLPLSSPTGWPCTLFRSTAAKAAVLGKHLALRCPDSLTWKLQKTGTTKVKLHLLAPVFCAPQGSLTLQKHRESLHLCGFILTAKPQRK